MQRTGLSTGHTIPTGQSASESRQEKPTALCGHCTLLGGHGEGSDPGSVSSGHVARQVPSTHRFWPDAASQVIDVGQTASVAAQEPDGQRTVLAGHLRSDGERHCDGDTRHDPSEHRTGNVLGQREKVGHSERETRHDPSGQRSLSPQPVVDGHDDDTFWQLPSLQSTG